MCNENEKYTRSVDVVVIQKYGNAKRRYEKKKKNPEKTVAAS